MVKDPHEHGYMCKECDRNRASAKNKRINAISKLAARIAGGVPALYRMEKEQRIEVRMTAAKMHDLGVDFSAAAKAEHTEKRGFVYVITHPAFPGYVKIGRAFDPESRLRGYQTGCPHRAYKLNYVVYFDDCHMAEKEIHARLEDEYRNGALGEWFQISPFLARHNINKLRSII